MNIGGAYIHKNQDLLETRPTFQWGALASQWESLSWANIATAQMKAGKSGYAEDQLLFDNSIRGLPYRRRKTTDTAIDSIRKHATPIPEDLELENVFMSCDTQDDCVYYIIRGFDSNCNSYLLAHGKAMTLEDLTEIWDGEYMGCRCVLGIIDSGGHRTAEIQSYCEDKKALWMYKGNNSLRSGNVAQSDNVRGLLMARAKFYQDRMLYYIYNHNAEADNYNWYLPHDIDDEYVSQIGAMRPDNKTKHGDDYENWINHGNDDHFFDCEKMMLCLFDFAKRKLRGDEWRIGKIEGIRKRKKKIKPVKKAGGFVGGW